MAWYVWAILGLLVLSFFQFYSPKTNDMLDPLYSKATPYIEKINILESKCSDEINYVCGTNNVTYQNPCFAGIAGITEVIMGACPNG
jgi:hypothetical protein